MIKSPWLHKGYLEWQEGNTAYLSVVFSWHLQTAYQQAIWWRAQGYKVIAGGPAVDYNPGFLSDVAKINGAAPVVLERHNPNATRTSTGCIRNCPFCVVPRIEGALVELKRWDPRPMVCDNNLLACSQVHFDRVIDRLKPVKQVDFNQGLDARCLTAYKAQRLLELDLKCLRLAWDSLSYERSFHRAFELLTKSGFPANKIHVYVLLGFEDTPEDALYRLETIRGLGAWPNPMRYQPLGAKVKNEYVAPDWSARELARFTRYWSRLTWLGHFPFSEYRG